MSRNNKAIFFGLLFLTSVSQLAFGKWQLGILLMSFAFAGMLIFEKREANRQFYVALRKLFVCSDRDAFRAELNWLQNNMLIKKYVAIPVQVLEWIDDYYSGNRSRLIEEMSKLRFEKDYEFWRLSYLCMLNKDETMMRFIVIHQKYVPKHFSVFALERVGVLGMMISEDLDRIAEYRAELTANLFIAELTYTMSCLCDDIKLQAYYRKSAMNLSKGLIL